MFDMLKLAIWRDMREDAKLDASDGFTRLWQVPLSMFLGLVDANAFSSVGFCVVEHIP